MTAGSLSVGIFSVDNVSLQKMNQMSLRVKSGLTKRALDAGKSARFSSVFSASAFFSVDGVPPSAPAQVTQTVGRQAD